MRVIVTGGTGLIGRALADSLLADQHEVILVSRNPAYMRNPPKGAKLEKWDGRTSAGWGQRVDGADAVVNLAGESIAGNGVLSIVLGRWWGRRKSRIVDSRKYAGAAVTQAIHEAKRRPKVLIQASAVGYYGVLNSEPLSEDMPRGNDFQASVCWEWELSTSPVEVMGVRRVVLRSGLVMTRKGGILHMLKLPFRFFAGGRIGNSRQIFPWIHIDDEVGAIRFLMDNPSARGAFNLAAPGAITNGQLAKLLGRILRRPSFFPVPAFALRLMMGEKATLVLDGWRPSPQRLIDAGYTFKFPEAEPAFRNLLKKK